MEAYHFDCLKAQMLDVLLVNVWQQDGASRMVCARLVKIGERGDKIRDYLSGLFPRPYLQHSRYHSASAFSVKPSHFNLL